jgi:transcriptional regulator with XRE-family HTH domain
MTIGDRIRQARVLAGLTQQQLADRAFDGIGRQRIYRWETGDRVPKADAIARIAAALEVSPSWIMYGEGDAPRRP